MAPGLDGQAGGSGSYDAVQRFGVLDSLVDLLFLLVDFLPVHLAGAWRGDADLHLGRCDAHHRDDNLVVDDDLLIDLSGKH